MNLAYPLQSSRNKNAINSKAPKGINLIGYARAEMGIGESCRLAARSLDTVGLPFNIINYIGTNSARMSDTSWSHKEVKNPLYNVNIFHINAEQMMEVYGNLGNSIFDNRYNIGYWHWELPDFPEEWLENIKFLNEIWVPSRFVADSISIKSPVPIIRIPHGILIHLSSNKERSDFNLPPHPFLFLSMYDVHSYQERKNPKSVIEAFKSAFSSTLTNVGLVIKVNNAKSNPKELALLENLISEYPNIYLVKETLSREDTYSLLNTTNCFVSLHRSEGFGLGLAEAMYLGKPVIGTNWSSNTDFMTTINSCLVDYKIKQLGQDYGPYKSHQYWAEPDMDHAAFFMKKIVDDELFRNDISIKGQRTIKDEFSPKVVGEMVQKRLKYLNLI